MCMAWAVEEVFPLRLGFLGDSCIACNAAVADGGTNGICMALAIECVFCTCLGQVGSSCIAHKEMVTEGVSYWSATVL